MSLVSDLKFFQILKTPEALLKSCFGSIFSLLIFLKTPSFLTHSSINGFISSFVAYSKTISIDKSFNSSFFRFVKIASLISEDFFKICLFISSIFFPAESSDKTVIIHPLISGGALLSLSHNLSSFLYV
ncbi:TPA: hypothetical protein DEG21_04875 [Patescibacteria group bacterium]|nr:hypothetical protein [Candidatus Gracilibacteria bacterium]HBY75164.1 hypothetical protein [Candidatus Gracilibacteria bacterium]